MSEFNFIAVNISSTFNNVSIFFLGDYNIKIRLLRVKLISSFPLTLPVLICDRTLPTPAAPPPKHRAQQSHNMEGAIRTRKTAKLRVSPVDLL